MPVRRLWFLAAVVLRASPYSPPASSAEADWLAHGLHESRALLPTITVRAFIRYRTTMPSADFCCEIKAPCGAFSHDPAVVARKRVGHLVEAVEDPRQLGFGDADAIILDIHHYPRQR